MSNTNEDQVTAELIVSTFELLVLDPDWVAGNARKYSSVDTWISSQAWQTGVTGAVALAIPVAHLPLIAADLLFLFHKMAYCSLGIGTLKGCEIEPREDFAMILGLYSGELSEKALEAAAGTGAVALAGGVVATVGLPKFVGKLSEVGAAELGKKLAAKTVLVAGKKLPIKALGASLQAGAPVIGAISGKLAEKLSAKFATKAFVKTAASAVGGFVPLLGSLIGGGINMYFVHNIADSASRYYEIKARVTAVS